MNELSKEWLLPHCEIQWSLPAKPRERRILVTMSEANFGVLGGMRKVLFANGDVTVSIDRLADALQFVEAK